MDDALKMLDWLLTAETYGSVSWVLDRLMLRLKGSRALLLHGWGQLQDIDRRMAVKDMFDRTNGIEESYKVARLLEMQEKLNS